MYYVPDDFSWNITDRMSDIEVIKAYCDQYAAFPAFSFSLMLFLSVILTILLFLIKKGKIEEEFRYMFFTIFVFCIDIIIVANLIVMVISVK